MKFFIFVAFAVVQILDFSRAAVIPDHLLVAPKYPDGRSPEEFGGFFQGDIIKSGKLQNGYLRTASKWPDNTVPYIIEARYPASDKAVILAAMAEISSKTCIKFVERTTQAAYVSIRSVPRLGCSAYLGRVGGLQYINLLSTVDNPRSNCIVEGKGPALHEILHTLGFVHMQASFDRDNFVKINLENVLLGYGSEFNKETSASVGYFGTSYDYASVMHYGRNTFSKNGKDTITTKDASQQNVIGQRTQLSTGDIARIRNMYTC